MFPNVDRRVLALTAGSHKAPAAAWDASRGDIPCFRHKRSALSWRVHLLPRWLGNLSGEWLCEFQHSSLLIQVTLYQIEGTRRPHYTEMSFDRTPSYQDVGLSIMWCMNSMDMAHPRASVP